MNLLLEVASAFPRGVNGASRTVEPVNNHGVRHILQDLWSEVHETQIHLVPDLSIHLFRDADLSTFRKRLNPRRDIHRVSIDIIPLMDHIAQMDTYPHGQFPREFLVELA